MLQYYIKEKKSNYIFSDENNLHWLLKYYHAHTWVSAIYTYTQIFTLEQFKWCQMNFSNVFVIFHHLFSSYGFKSCHQYFHLSTQTKSTVCHHIYEWKWEIVTYVVKIKRPLVAEMMSRVFRPAFFIMSQWHLSFWAWLEFPPRIHITQKDHLSIYNLKWSWGADEVPSCQICI